LTAQKNKLTLFLVLFLLTTKGLAQNNAREIMEMVDGRDDGYSSSSVLTMVLIDKKGKKRTRTMKTFAKDIGENTTYSATFFLTPGDVKNTAFLTYDYSEDNKDDDQWMYLPALKKTKRIPASDKDASFMGSDFSYSDMTSKELEDYDYKVIKEAVIKRKSGNVPVWIIESLPREKKTIEETGYTKSTLYVRKDNFVLVRAKLYLNVSNKVKYMDVRKLDKISGIWVPTQTTMTTKQGKQTIHKTLISQTNTKINIDIKNDLFTIRSIERGL
jgi:hypothetical protein